MGVLGFFRAARPLLALVIVLPLLAMSATVGLLLPQPVEYTATAVVDPSALVGGLDTQYAGAQGVTQFVSAFEATASGPVVRSAVVARTKVSPDDLAAGLVVTQRGTSASLAVEYTGMDEDTVVPILEGVTVQTLHTLFESQVQTAQAAVDRAKRAVAAATAAISQFTAKNAVADPQNAYEAQLARVDSLVQQQAFARAAGNAVGAAAMATSIAAAEAELTRFAPLMTGYRTLTTARTVAVQALDAANAKLAAASMQLANADPSKIVYVGSPQAVDRSQHIVRATVSVGAAAFLLALVLVLVLVLTAAAHEAPETT